MSQETVKVIEERKLDSNKSLWRVSSTLFSHIQSDKLLEPIGQFKTTNSLALYPPILTGQQVFEF